MSPGFRSAATLRSYLSEILCHMPERSGLPSAVRGAGAVRFGLPSAVRGMPGVGWFSHCAAKGIVSADKMVAMRTVFIRLPPANNRPESFRVFFTLSRGEEPCLRRAAAFYSDLVL